MDKKYQVFISSTYTDMKAERQTAVEAILDAGHIPAGMELFAASDKQQIDVIKNWIDRSDIFMLVLGGRYGSVEPDSGKSYIQLEYEYALEKKKPFFALYLTDAAIDNKVKAIGSDALEKNDSKKLNEFRALVKSKLCSEIEDLKDIRIQVPKAIRDLSASGQLEGWVRASSVPDISPLMDELANLRADNSHLKSENAHLSVTIAQSAGAKSARTSSDLLPPFSGHFSEGNLDAPLRLELTVDMDGEHLFETRRMAWKGTYRDMFALIGAKLLDEPLDGTIQGYVNKLLVEQTPGSMNVTVLENSFQSMKMKLVALGLTDLHKTAKGLSWRLTENGKALLVKLHSA